MIQQKDDKIMPQTTIAMFENQNIRRERYNDERWFSVVDIVSVLSWSLQPSRYWTELKQQLIKKEWYTDLFGKIEKLKFLWADNKKYPWDAANTKTVLRIIQSIPSPNAEPLKQRLAQLGNEKVEEANDPELGMQRARDRAIAVYKSRWMNDKEIKQRLQTIDIRHDYTDELKARWIKDGLEYALLTNISYTRSGKSAKEYKQLKWLVKSDNLRDHMTMTELLLTWLSEEAGKEIAKSKNAKWFNEVQDALIKWADIAKNTREDLENKIWKSVLIENNRLTEKQKTLRDKAHNQEKLGYNKK